jgi:peptide/nickel transport system substrate-binding protein
MPLLARMPFGGAWLALAIVTLCAPALGASLTIALPANVVTLDPHKSTTVATDLSVIGHFYTPLVDRGPDLKLKPGLAKSWRAVNATTWRFELTPGVTFPDGEPLDAAAVKWNIDRVLDPKTAARIKPWFTPITEARVVDANTLEFITKEPYPALPDQMAMFFLLPPKWSAQNNPAVAALGSGPYDLVEFKSGDRIVMKAKPSWWGGKVPYDQVTFRVMPEDSSRIAALLAGEVDLITVFPPSEIKRINDSGRASAGAVPSTRFMFVKFNNLRSPFKNNVKLRLALNYAVDKQAILDSLWNGQGAIANCQVLSPDYFGYNPDLKPIPYDPKKAKQLLTEAGFPNGLDLELEITIGRYIQSADIAQIIAAQLGDIGVRVKITEMEFARWLDKYRVARNLGDMAYFGLAWPTLDADGLLAFWETANDQAYYENATVDGLIKQARAITDRDKRLAIYKQVTKAMCDDPPHIFMFFQPFTYAERKNVSWQKRGDDWMRAMDVAPK